MYLDGNGLLVTRHGDGGDTAQHEGMYGYGVLLNPTYNNQRKIKFQDAIQMLTGHKKGHYVRHPTQYPELKDMSRDQARSIIIALGEYKMYDRIKDMFKAQLKRFGLYQNKDIMSPQHLSEFLRSMPKLIKYISYPVYLIGDLFMLLDTLIICFWRAKEPGKIRSFLGKYIHYLFIQGEATVSGIRNDVYGIDNVGTDKNHIMSLLQAKKNAPTPISYLARKIYKKYRPNGAIYALKHYFRNENWEMADLYENILKEL